jgi:hypothetical protein
MNEKCLTKYYWKKNLQRGVTQNYMTCEPFLIGFTNSGLQHSPSGGKNIGFQQTSWDETATC